MLIICADCYQIRIMAARNGTSLRARARMHAFGLLDDDESPCELRPDFRLRTRPAKSLADLPANWKEIMSESALRGQGVDSWLVYLNLNNSSLNSLLRDEPEFVAHYELCLRVQKAWMMNKGLEIMVSGEGSHSVWMLYMANNYGWKSAKAEVSGNSAEPVAVKFDLQNASDEEIDEMLGIPKF